MGPRTGATYLAGLRDARSVWLDGERVTSVPAHPLLGGSARGIAGYYDWQLRYSDQCVMDDDELGAVAVSHMIPRSREDLLRRHSALEQMARYSGGILGRAPDFMNVSIAGYVALPSVWAKNGNADGYANLVAFRRECAKRDLALTHAIVHPTIDNRLSKLEGVNGAAALRKIGETSHGIVIRGTRLLATLAPFADEICVFPGTPMPAADPSLFVAFALPLSTPGVLVLCRDHYGSRASPHDAPFSARFDEQDAYVVFDEVEVPWHRIFLDGDGEIYHLVRERGWIANIMQQTCIRAQVKLELAHELCTRMAEALGLAERRDVEEMLGEIWSYGEIVRTAVVAAEAEAHDDFGDGVMFCNERPFAAIRGLIPLWMERVNAIIRSFGSHYLLITPSERDLASDELNPYHRSYLRGVDGTEPFERSRLFRAGWDLACSALGSRSLLFEQFYLGSTATSFSSAHRRATVSRKVSWSALF